MTDSIQAKLGALFSSRSAALPSAAAMAILLTASPAFAHHAMGGGVPSTLGQGLLSGFGHPVIGVDHLAFVIAVGIASAFLANRWMSPLAFVAGTVAGCLLMIAGLTLPLTEIVITASVVALGALVLSGKSIPATVYPVLFALAGLFHGNAYGQSIVGAEATPLLAYLIGFATIQFGIALGAGWLVTNIGKAVAPQAIAPRLAGAVAAGVGVALLIENIEGLIFA